MHRIKFNLICILSVYQSYAENGRIAGNNDSKRDIKIIIMIMGKTRENGIKQL
jgi:hypothetical protein